MAMQFRRTLAICSCLSILLGFSIVAAQVDEKSVFPLARTPASELDLKLIEVQTNWRMGLFLLPSAETRQKHQLIIKTGVDLQLRYNLDDRISATAWANNTDAFLTLS